MEKSKEVLLTLFVMALLVMNSSIIFAQQHNKPPRLPDEEGIARMIEDMAKELSLTEEQKNTIIILHKDHFAMLQKLMKTGKTQREEIRARHEQLRLKLESEMRVLMLNEQLGKFEEYLKKMEARHSSQEPGREGMQGRN